MVVFFGIGGGWVSCWFVVLIGQGLMGVSHRVVGGDLRVGGSWLLMWMQQLLLSAITVDNYVKASGLQHTSEISECMYIDDIALVFNKYN